MCMFSGTIADVSQTQMFARAAGDKQILVYSMNVTLAEPVAMILPLPVPPGSPEDAVRFINLERCPQFFSALKHMFERQDPVSLGGDDDDEEHRRRLVVHDVGRFVASFVPTQADFARLDPRFRLPDSVWAGLSQYADWGFAVFQLKPPPPPPPRPKLSASVFGFMGFQPAAASAAQPQPIIAAAPASKAPAAPAPAVQYESRETPLEQRVHPMALEFPRRDRRQIFFPTVHVHDGHVHDKAWFDHELFLQLERLPTRVEIPSRVAAGSESADSTLARFLDRELTKAVVTVEKMELIERTQGVVAPLLPVYKLELSEGLPNQDTSLYMDEAAG